MSDEWDMFGSDDEESESNDELSSSSSMFKHSFENASDAITTLSTQNFLRMNRNVPLTQRYVGILKYNNDHKEEGIANELMWNLSESLSKKIEQRGMKVEALPSSLSRELQDTAGFDCALLARIFLYKKITNAGIALEPISNNPKNFKRECWIRKNLVVGGFLMVAVVIKCKAGEILSDVDDERMLLDQWKTTEGYPIFSNSVWDVENAKIVFHEHDAATDSMACTYSLHVVCVTKRPCTVNKLSCSWKTNQKKVPQSYYDSCDDIQIDENWIDFEYRILSKATISKSVHEQRLGNLTRESRDRAVKALQNYGFVVLPGLFRNARQEILDWSEAILKDFDRATDTLKSQCNVDIQNPGEGSDPLSYREMAMREDFRVDLRDGPHMRKIRNLARGVDDAVLEQLGYKVLDGGVGTTPTIVDQTKGDKKEELKSNCGKISLRYDPSILEIVRKLQNPHNMEGAQGSSKNAQPLHKGNFGRWNFSGSGPNGMPQPIRIGQIGSVISLPGAGDQCVHADTAHIFETQDCLPCHYANLFILGQDVDERTTPSLQENFDCDGNFTGRNLTGGTAFVACSHRLSMTARLTADKGMSAAGAEESAQNEMHMRTIRPSLQLGDAIIFDTRILHFGLANRNPNASFSKDSVKGLRRPMLYVNMTHSWFFDPKNWDDKQSIFDNE